MGRLHTTALLQHALETVCGPKGKDLRLLSGDLLKRSIFFKKKKVIFLIKLFILLLEQGSNMDSAKAVLTMLNARC